MAWYMGFVIFDSVDHFIMNPKNLKANEEGIYPEEVASKVKLIV